MMTLNFLLTALLPLLASDIPADTGTMSWWWYIVGGVVLAIIIIGIIAYRAGGELKVPIRLVVTGGTHTGSEFPLQSTFVTIGSERDNDIVVNDDKVSKHHARLTYAKSTLTITDANSLYGTFVNGERVERAVCRDGDVIRLGTTFECRVMMPK
jgi:hypothetical protein